MRELKFRAWNATLNTMIPPYSGIFNARPYTEKSSFPQYESCPECHDLIIMQYTGLKDKSGVEIYEGDLLLVKNLMGDDKEHFTECVFQAYIDPLDGIVLRVKSLYGGKKDNQIPVEQRLASSNGSLCLDTRNSNYEQIAVDDTYGENHMHNNRWKINNYSNNIEVIGNIHSNPELLETTE